MEAIDGPLPTEIDAHLTKIGEEKANLWWTVQNAPPKYALSVKVDETDVSVDDGAEEAEEVRRIVDDRTIFEGSARMLWRQIVIELLPGKSYDCHLDIRTVGSGGHEKKKKKKNKNKKKGQQLLDSWHQCVARKPDERKYLSRIQMNNLMKNAKKFCSNAKWKPVYYFSRCQSDEEWAEVEQQKVVISARVRVFNHGHHRGQMSRLSYSYGGVYFFARPLRIKRSPFGNHLKEFPADTLFDADNLALFFADIKCYGDYYPDEQRTHYITIAVCLRGSEEEEFCNKRKLKQLDPRENAFLRFSPESGQFLVPVREIDEEWGLRNPIWIELFLMRDVKIANLDKLRSREVKLMKKWNVRADRPLSYGCKLCRATGKRRRTSADTGSTDSSSSHE